MKYILLVVSVSFITVSYSAELQYNMKVDGITCPFCVATSARELKIIDGVKSVTYDLEKGLIKVCADESVTFTDKQLEDLFVEKGFTYKRMDVISTCDKI